MDIALLAREHWKLLLSSGVLFSVIAIVSYKLLGSRRSGKNWLHNMEKEGTTQNWVKLTLTRKPETFFVEGWSKSEWGEAYSYLKHEVYPELSLFCLIRIHCVRIITSHLIWKSVLGKGEQDTWREMTTLEGVTLSQDEKGNWGLIEKAPELLETRSVPYPSI